MTKNRKPPKFRKSCSLSGRAVPRYGLPSASCGRPPLLDTESGELMECIEDNEEVQSQPIVDYTVAPNGHDYAEEPKPLLEQLQTARLRLVEQQSYCVQLTC